MDNYEIPLERKNYTLVMKGGGIKGLAYLGALEELESFYSFNSFAGTSAGAISAVLLAAGYSTTELKKELGNKNFSDFKDAGYFRMFWNLLSKKGFYEALSFKIWLQKLLAHKLDLNRDVKLKDLPYRAIVYATKRGQNALIFDSNIPETNTMGAAFAARCSMAIPFIFTPERNEGLYVFDGGVRNNYPVEVLLQHNPDIKFIGLYLGDEIFQGDKKRSIISELFSIWAESTDEEALTRYANETIVIDPKPITTLEFSLNDEEKYFLIEKGRLAAWKFLDKNNLINHNAYLERKKEKTKELDEIKEKLTKVRLKRKTKMKFISFIVGVFILVLIYLGLKWYFQTPSPLENKLNSRVVTLVTKVIRSASDKKSKEFDSAFLELDKFRYDSISLIKNQELSDKIIHFWVATNQYSARNNKDMTLSKLRSSGSKILELCK